MQISEWASLKAMPVICICQPQHVRCLAWSWSRGPSQCAAASIVASPCWCLLVAGEAPALLLTANLELVNVVAVHCSMSGIVNVGEHMASEPLTPALHMINLLPHQADYMQQLARACAALRTCTAALRAGYDDGSLQALAASRLPYDLR